MKPRNFPAQKLARQLRAQKINDPKQVEAARNIRTKKLRGIKRRAV